MELSKPSKCTRSTLAETVLPVAFEQLDAEARERVFAKIARRQLGLCPIADKYFPPCARLILHVCGSMTYSAWKRVKARWLEVESRLVCGWMCPGVYECAAAIHLLTAPGDVPTEQKSYIPGEYRTKRVKEWMIHDWHPRTSYPTSEVVTRDEFFALVWRCNIRNVTLDTRPLKDVLMDVHGC
jgi:hypothetical protein